MLGFYVALVVPEITNIHPSAFAKKNFGCLSVKAEMAEVCRFRDFPQRYVGKVIRLSDRQRTT